MRPPAFSPTNFFFNIFFLGPASNKRGNNLSPSLPRENPSEKAITFFFQDFEKTDMVQAPSKFLPNFTPKFIKFFRRALTPVLTCVSQTYF